jgi:hypothetical protein
MITADSPPGTQMANLLVWRLQHPNGQATQCTVAACAGTWQLHRWVNGFVASAEQFPKRDAALIRATELREGLEARGFRDELYA